jgi:hypothetical protein
VVDFKKLYLVYRIIIDPINSFKLLKDLRVYDSICYILSFGWVTALFSGFLSLYGIDYSNPSNVGGSAQLFACWALQILNQESNSVITVLFFAFLVMVGYLTLAFVSTPIVASIAWLFTGRTNFNYLIKLAYIAVIYGMTPGFLFGWIPNPFYLIGIWATLWQGLAVKEVYSLSWWKALTVVSSWIIIVGVIHDLAELLINTALYE